MSDLISLKKLHREIATTCALVPWHKALFHEVADSIPTVDAASVVRCKDCKQFMMMPDIGNNEHPACVQIMPSGEYIVSRWVDENGFCDWGNCRG